MSPGWFVLFGVQLLAANHSEDTSDGTCLLPPLGTAFLQSLSSPLQALGVKKHKKKLCGSERGGPPARSSLGRLPERGSGEGFVVLELFQGGLSVRRAGG